MCFFFFFHECDPKNEGSMTQGNHCCFELPFLHQPKNTQTFKQVLESLGIHERNSQSCSFLDAVCQDHIEKLYLPHN